MLSVLKKCKGRHCSLSDVIPDEECFVAGNVVEEKRGNKSMELKKYVLSEVLPDGGCGKKFALFIIGVSSTLPVRVNDVFVIHNPLPNQSHLIKHMDLFKHNYEDQIIINDVIIDVHDVAPENRKVIELLELERLALIDDSVAKGSESEDCLSHNLKRIHSQDELLDEINGEKGLDPSKKRKVDDGLGLQKYTKLQDIKSSPASVNIIGIIRSVEEGTQLSNGERLMKIYLEDESSRNSKFQLNLISRIVDVPPLHYGYILKASNVMIQATDKDVSGWLSSGKSIATVESDVDKPITLLTTQIDPDLTEEDKKRIIELREFINHNSFNYAMSSESERSISDSEDKELNQARERSGKLESDDDCSLRLHLSSSDSDESLSHAQDAEEILSSKKDLPS